MNNLFDPALGRATKQRILQLQPESERQWGSMTVGHMLARCTVASGSAVRRSLQLRG